MRGQRRPAIVPVALVVLALVAACGGSDPEPAPSNGKPGGSIVGSSTSGFVNSSGGASGQNSSGNTSSGGPKPTDLVDTTDETVDVGGTERSFMLSKPKILTDGKKYPLVIMFHGNPGTPKEMHDALPFDYASKDGAFIAYPAAGDGSDWNLNLPGDGNADMDMVKALIDDLASKHPIDPDRVLGFGYSGGGYFLSQYACRVGGVLKMVAIISGGAPEFHDGDEKRPGPNECVVCPGGATPMFIAHGMADESDVPFTGGDQARICWAQQNGCDNSSLKSIGGPCKEYKGCVDGKKVQWCAVPDLGHAPWGDSLGAAWVMFNGL